MLNLVLVEPEIPPNCGNVARTSVVTGCMLHLVHPLGFDVSDAAARRAGLDYWPRLHKTEWPDLETFLEAVPADRLWLATSHGTARYDRVTYRDGDYILFGKETAGLPRWLLERCPDRCIRIPMLPGERCLNLSNSVAVAAYEALRQLDFPGLS